MAGAWIACLVWLYVEVPGGVGIVILSGSLGMALASYPQLPVHLVFKPVVVAITFASSLYIFVMPRLSTFTELALLIFAVTFAICYLFHEPRQIIGRVIGLAMFVVLAGISNGTRAFAQSISVIETCRKRGASPWPYLAKVIRQRRKGLPAPPLPQPAV